MKVHYASILKRIKAATVEAEERGLVIDHIEVTTPEFSCLARELREMGVPYGPTYIGPQLRSVFVGGVDVREVTEHTYRMPCF